jgi:hypothetical protein
MLCARQSAEVGYEGFIIDEPNTFAFALGPKDFALNRRPEVVLGLGPGEQIERRSGKSRIGTGGPVAWQPDIDRKCAFL